MNNVTPSNGTQRSLYLHTEYVPLLNLSTHLPNIVSTCLLGEVDFFRSNFHLQLDVNNWP